MSIRTLYRDIVPVLQRLGVEQRGESTLYLTRDRLSLELPDIMDGAVLKVQDEI